MSKHRGKHSNDDACFNHKWRPIIAQASQDLSFLLGKNYGLKSSLALVGNHYRLNARQQRLLSLITCPANKIDTRIDKALPSESVAKKNIAIDGFNLLINIEALLSGGYIFVCQDNCYRDIASIHGSYKKVVETLPALMIINQAIQQLQIHHVQWYFDKPVSNAGMLKTLLYEYAVAEHIPWDIELVNNPDNVLKQTHDIVISSDSEVIDHCHRYFNMTQYIIDHVLTTEVVNVLDFRSVT